RRPALPAAADLRAFATDTAAAEDSLTRTGPDSTGRRMRATAVPVWDNTSAVGAVVVAGADPGPSEHDHHILMLWLELGGAALITLAAAAGHLLSGVSMRSAVRLLDDQERFLADAS